MGKFLPFAVILTYCFIFEYHQALSNIHLITKFSQDVCIQMSIAEDYQFGYYYYLDEKGLPTCKAYSENGDAGGVCETNQQCPGGYLCEKRCNSAGNPRCETNDDCPKRGKCIQMCYPDEGTCMAYYSKSADFQQYFAAAKIKPKCDNLGLFKPVQCKGEVDGRCFCYTSRGKQIFGESLYKQSSKMTCGCSLKREELEEPKGLSNERSFISLHCDSLGNYEPLQCVKGQCWCVEPTSGELTAPVVPESAMKYLPCYDAVQVGAQYYRKCDSEFMAQAVIRDHMKKHGVNVVNFRPLMCDFDGSYGAYNVSSGIAYCMWRDGTKLGSWQSEAGAYAGMNCNCARDFKKYQHTKICSNNGNYNDMQRIPSTGESYCVDLNGFAVSDILKPEEVDCTAYDHYF